MSYPEHRLYRVLYRRPFLDAPPAAALAVPLARPATALRLPAAYGSNALPFSAVSLLPPTPATASSFLSSSRIRAAFSNSRFSAAANISRRIAARRSKMSVSPPSALRAPIALHASFGTLK